MVSSRISCPNSPCENTLVLPPEKFLFFVIRRNRERIITTEFTAKTNLGLFILIAYDSKVCHSRINVASFLISLAISQIVKNVCIHVHILSFLWGLACLTIAILFNTIPFVLPLQYHWKWNAQGHFATLFERVCSSKDWEKEKKIDWKCFSE